MLIRLSVSFAPAAAVCPVITLLGLKKSENVLVVVSCFVASKKDEKFELLIRHPVSTLAAAFTSSS